MTGRGRTSGWRQVVNLLAAFGVGAALVLVGGAFAPDLLRIPVPTAGEQPEEQSGETDVVGAPAAPSADGAPSRAPTAPAEDDGADREDGADRTTGTGRGEDRDAGDPDPSGTTGSPEASEGTEGTESTGGTEDPDDTADPGASGDLRDSAAVLALVDVERAASGCPALRTDDELDALGAAHAADMRDRGYFDHTDPDGRTPWDRATAAGVDGVAAENIAQGQADAAAVVAAWMDSPGHRANILDCSLTRHGLGRADGQGGPWWVQVFGR